MANILIAGLINTETTVQVDRFPISYAPVRFAFGGIKTTISGVGFNISKSLTTLGNTVTLLSLIGQDFAGDTIKSALQKIGINNQYVMSQLNQTPQSVILFDPEGQRAINTDLKDIQEQSYPEATFDNALANCDLAVLANINFSRPMLAKAHEARIPIATDIHTISDINDTYNRDYMRYATILFQSHERLPISSEAWIRLIWAHYKTPIVVVGMGTGGALLGVHEDNKIVHIEAVFTRPVVNTIGAGDSLFSSFIHVYNTTKDPYLALRKAVVFASYKIGGNGGADGFLTNDELEHWHEQVYS